MSTSNNDHNAPGTKREHRSSPFNNSSNNQPANGTDISSLLNGHFGKPAQRVSPSSSPPNKKSLTMNEMSEIKASAWNLAMAHEIALQGNLNIQKLQDRSGSEELLTKTVKNDMCHAHWQQLREELQATPPIFEHAIVVLTDLKDMLLSLLADDRITTLHKRIYELLDMDLLRQQAHHLALDIHKLSLSVVDTMAAMCAPVRDQDVADLYAITDTVDILRKMFEVLDVMKMDKINALVAAITPHIQEHHVQYEREKFSAILSKLPGGPVATEKWLESTYQEMTHNPTLTQTNQVNANAKSPLAVLKVAYTKLLTWNNESQSFPETVAIDQERFADLRLEFERTILVATIILTSLPTLSSDLFSHYRFVQTLKRNLTILLSDLKSYNELSSFTKNLVEQVWKDTSEYCQNFKPLLPILTTQNKKNLEEQLMSLNNIQQSHVFKLLEKRGIDHFLTTADVMTIPAGSRPQLPPVPAALKLVLEEIQSLAMKYSKLVNLNRAVYGPFYSSLLKKIISLPSHNNT